MTDEQQEWFRTVLRVSKVICNSAEDPYFVPPMMNSFQSIPYSHSPWFSFEDPYFGPIWNQHDGSQLVGSGASPVGW